MLKKGSDCVALVKPQFEAGRGKVGKNGVVRDKNTHIEVLEETARFAAGAGFEVRGADFSPITGPKGNIEFLLHLHLPLLDGGEEGACELTISAREVVENAHAAFED